MNKVISFPHLENYYHPISKLWKDVTKEQVILAPPITKKNSRNWKKTCSRHSMYTI